jgi:hypothetical protein
MGQAKPVLPSQSRLPSIFFAALLTTLVGCEFSKIQNGKVACGPQPHPCPGGYYCSSVTNTCWENGSGPDASAPDVAPGETGVPIDGPPDTRGPALDGSADATIDQGQLPEVGSIDGPRPDANDAPPAGPEVGPGLDVSSPADALDAALEGPSAEAFAVEAGLPGPDVSDGGPDAADAAAEAQPDTGPLPVIGSFTATPAAVTAGKSSTLQWSVTGAAAISIDQGIGTVTGTGSKSVTPSQTTTYTLTAQNAGGGMVTAQAKVTVVPLPTIDSFTASPATISAGSSATLLAIFHDGSAASISRGVGNVTSGSGASTGPLTTPASYTYTLTVTNAAGDSVTKDASVTVVPLPTITSFTADATSIPIGNSTNLTATFANGTGAIDHDIGSVTSGVGVNTGVLADATTYTLTVTNTAGDSATQQLTVRVTGFAVTGSMTAVRMRHTATRLNNGTVLVAGGWTTNYVCLASAETYDPGTGKFTATTGTMTTAREYHTATLLPSGKVLLTGGLAGGSGNPMDSAELYDPSARTFTATTTPMTTGRIGHTATLLGNGKVFIAGGMNGDYLRSAELYDPTANGFTAVSSGQMVDGRGYHTATLVGSKVLLAGGRGTSDYLTSAEIYDTVTGYFTSTTNAMNAKRASLAATLLNGGKVLITGGDYMEMGNLIATKTADLYDPTTSPGSFAATTAMATGRALHTATLLTTNQVLVAGGNGGGAGTTAEVYDAAGGTPTVTGSLNVSRYEHTATLLSNGKVLIAGGQDGTNIWSSAELYLY